MCFPRELPAGMVVEFAQRLEAGGADELWLIEDCFYTTGPSLAAAALARTERLNVGIGILPAVARTAAMTAMEIATLAALAPGRVTAGIGHGVQPWMEQMGVRPASPLTALGEVIAAVKRLLAGETVDVHGDYVTLRDVTLDQPPHPVPPVLAGVRGPRSLAVAGAVADGVVLAELTGPTAIREAIAQAAPTRPFEVVVYSPVCIDDDRQAARAVMAGATCATCWAIRLPGCGRRRSSPSSPPLPAAMAPTASRRCRATGGPSSPRSALPPTLPPTSTRSRPRVRRRWRCSRRRSPRVPANNSSGS